jgi:two-component SAPR family response regulator
MRTRVVVFDDEERDLKNFEKMLSEAGCDVMAYNNANIEPVENEILVFNPELAVVDSKFGPWESVGLDIVARLREMIPGIKIVVCSVLLAEGAPRQNSLRKLYEQIELVKLLSKAGTCGEVLPSSSEILDG